MRTRIILFVVSTALIVGAVSTIKLFKYRQRQADVGQAESTDQSDVDDAIRNLKRHREESRLKWYKENRRLVDRLAPEEIFYCKMLAHEASFVTDYRGILFVCYENDFGGMPDEELWMPLLERMVITDEDELLPASFDWKIVTAKSARNLNDPSALIRAEIANNRLALAYQEKLRTAWEKLPCEIDPEFLTDVQLQAAATEWATRSLAALSISNSVKSLDGLAVPLRLFVLPPRPDADSNDAREKRESLRVWGFDENRAMDADWYLDPQGNPSVTTGSKCSITGSLDYRFESYDANTSTMKLVAEIPKRGIMHIPERAALLNDRNRPLVPKTGDPAANFLSQAIITPEIHSSKSFIREEFSDNPLLAYRYVARSAGSNEVVRYPCSTNGVDVVSVRLGPEAAAKMKREKMVLRVTQICALEYVWLLVSDTMNLENYRQEITKHGPRPPVRLSVIPQTRLRISTSHTLNGVTLDKLPDGEEWSCIVLTGKASPRPAGNPSEAAEHATARETQSVTQSGSLPGATNETSSTFKLVAPSHRYDPTKPAKSRYPPSNPSWLYPPPEGAKK